MDTSIHQYTHSYTLVYTNIYLYKLVYANFHEYTPTCTSLNQHTHLYIAKAFILLVNVFFNFLATPSPPPRTLHYNWFCLRQCVMFFLLKGLFINILKSLKWEFKIIFSHPLPTNMAQPNLIINLQIFIFNLYS